MLVDRRDGYAIATINRPEKMNALNAEVLGALEETMVQLKADRSVRAVILTGSGEKAFVAGADIRELNALDAFDGRLFAERGQRIFNAIERLGKPVIAAVNGFALGGGCELAMACHIRFAAEHAQFGQPEINLGIIPGYGGTQRLPRLVGQAAALELILGGERIDAHRALALGLVSRVIPLSSLMEESEKFAALLASKAPLALYACMESVQLAATTAALDGMHGEASLFSQVCSTQDFSEGTAAFLEKRAPKFVGQ